MLLLARLIDLYTYVILAAVILSWIRLPEDNPIVKTVNGLTEPVLGPVRRMLPDMGGIDISPMLVLVALRILRDALLR